MEDNEMFRTRKKLFLTSGGVRWTDLHAFGRASAGMHAFLQEVSYTGQDMMVVAPVTLHYDYYSEGADNAQTQYFFTWVYRD